MSPNATTRVFIVNTGALPTLKANRIEAAYYKTENGFTTFKDADNQPVFTVRDDHLVSVERAYDAEPAIAAFQELLRQATETGRASTTIKAKRPIGRNGAFHTDDFAVTIAANDCSDAPTSSGPVETTVIVNGSVATEGALIDAVRTGMRRSGGPGRTTV